MKKELKKILVALAFVLCMVVPSVMYASAEDATEETTTPSNGDTVTVDGATFVYYADVQAERTSKDATKTNKDGSTTKYYSAPTYESGYIFAGWYTDNSGEVDAENPLTETELSGSSVSVAWAKFVPSSILSVKAQVMGGINYASESTSIRFVTSVDTLNYRKVGFDFVVFNESNTKYGRETNTVYERLYAVGTDGKVLNYSPNYVFDTMSEYFMAYNFNNLTNKDFGHGISATPYWITLDGTLVYGTAGTKTVNQSYMGAITSVTMENVTSDDKIAHPSNWVDTPDFSITRTVHSQGGCAYGDYYYQAVINRYPGRSGDILSGYTYDETKNEVLIQRYKKGASGEWTLDGTSSSTMALYHANDITYNENLTYAGQTTSGLLVVSHNAGNPQLISFVDPSSLALVQPSDVKHKNGNALALAIEGTSYITINKNIYSIDYNALTNRYVVGLSGGQTYCILDADFNVVSDIYNQTQHKTTEYTHQGVVADDSFVYFILYYYPDDGVTPEHGGHMITVYDWNGNAVTTITIPTTSIPASLEPENIGIYNNEIYVACANGNYTSIYKVTGVSYSEEYEAFIDNTEGDDEYYFTLESAVMNADAGDTIVLLKDATITSPMPVLVDDITITNLDGENLTIKRESSYTGVMFDNEANGFTIQKNESGSLAIDGSSVSGKAVIINDEDASMSLNQITISNVTTSSNAAVTNISGDLTVSNCIFSGNTGASAGAVRGEGGTAGVITITDSQFTSNTSKGNGGAIAGTATFTITNSTFTSNVAASNGGAIHNGSDADTTIKGCTFTNNKAIDSTNTSQGGGAVFSQGKLTIQAYKVDETTTSSVFDGNIGEYKGGAIRFEGSSLTINDAEFKNNKTNNTSSSTYGGAIYTTVACTVSDSSFTSNTTNGDGGAIYHKSNKALGITDVNFTFNSANRAGAVFVDGGGTTTITGGTYTNNSATTLAGAFNQGTGTATVSGVTMTGNSVGESYAHGGGCAILIGGGTQLTLSNSTVKDNTSTYIGEDADKVVSDIAFRNNSSTGQPRLILTDSSFEGVVSWADKGECKNYGLVQFKTEYTGQGITFCKLSTFEDGQNLAEFEGEWSDEAKLATVDKVTVSNCEGQYLYDVVEETGAYGELNIAEATLTTSEVTTSHKYVSDAIAAAVADSENTVTAQRDAEVKSTIAVDDTIILTNAENSDINIYRGTTDNMFNVTGDMTITGSITIDGRTKANATKETPDTTGTSTSKTMILLDAGKLTLSGTTLQYANGSSSGGAVYVQKGGNMTASGTTFANNRAQNGAGIFVAKPSASTIEIKEESVFEGNVATAAGGGAIYSNKDAGVEAYLYLTNTTFKENSSKSQDGAVQVGGSAMTLIVDSCDFIGNYSAGDGGAVGVTSSTKKAEFKGTGTFQENYTTGGTSKAGGAINTNGSAISITGYTFDGNYAPSGGAINIKDGAAADGSAVAISGCTFKKNYTTSTTGGAINNLGRVLTVTECTFGETDADNGNSAKTIGGAIYTNATTTVTTSNFNENSAIGDGGAIYVNKGITLTNSDFTSNSGQRGGAVYVNAVGNGVSVDGGTYTYNSAAYAGGAFNQGTGTATIKNVTMQYNTAGALDPVKTYGCGGGAIMMGGSMTLTLTNSTVNNNGSTYEGDMADFHASDITFRDNGGSIPKLVLTDSTFDGVVTWNEETSTGDYGRIQFNEVYGGNGITLCKPSYMPNEKIVVVFGSGVSSDDDKAEIVSKLTVRGDYSACDTYAVGDYCVGIRTITTTTTTTEEDGTTTESSSSETGGVFLGTEAIIAKEDVPTTYYGALSEAVTAAESGDTVTVVKAAVTVDETISVDKAVTITNKEGVEPTITRGDSLTSAAMIAVTADGNLNVDGKIALDGNSVSASKSLITNAGTLTLGADIVVKNAKSTDVGAALYNSSSSSIANIYGDFINNIASSSGGAIRNNSGVIKIEGALFEGNQSVKYDDAGTVTDGGNGGAISGPGILVVKNSTFKGNIARQNGGALHSGYSEVLTTNENVTTVNGVTYETVIYGCTFEDNIASYGHTSNGAGAIIAECDLLIGDYVVDEKVVSTTTFDGNAAAAQGGAIRLNTTSANMDGINCTITGSTLFEGNIIKSGSAQGGAICNTGSYKAIVNITGATFKENSAKEGGAIYTQITGTTYTMIDCAFGGYEETTQKSLGNIASSAGGAIFMNGGTIYLSTTNGSKISYNQSSGQAGALRMGGSSTAYVTGYTFESNTAGTEGGAIRCGGYLYTNNCNFINNKSISSSCNGGGAIYTTDAAQVYLLADKECSFSGNTAASGSGARNAIAAWQSGNETNGYKYSKVYYSASYVFAAADTCAKCSDNVVLEETSKTYAQLLEELG